MAVTSAETADPSRPAARPARPLVIAVAVAIAIPFLVLLVRTVLSPWVSFSDWATIELRVRDVGTSSTPLVGPYSRYGWNHPGPLLFYALALPYRLLGREGKGLLFGTFLVNTGALAAIGVVLWRRGRFVGFVGGQCRCAAARPRVPHELPRRPVEPVRDRAPDPRGHDPVLGPPPTATRAGRSRSPSASGRSRCRVMSVPRPRSRYRS